MAEEKQLAGSKRRSPWFCSRPGRRLVKKKGGWGAVKGSSWRHGQEPEGKREAGTGERGQRTLKGLTLYDCDVSLSCLPSEVTSKLHAVDRTLVSEVNESATFPF